MAKKNRNNFNKNKTKIIKDDIISVRINDEFIQNSVDKVLDFLKNFVFPDKNSKFLLGVSGGIDSIVLLDIFYHLSQEFSYKVYVAHFNHKLRGKDSEEDIKFVDDLSYDYGFECYTGSGNVKLYAEKNNISTELSARALRYNFFERTSRNINADFVVTAHHKDDVAETFFINLIRGSGLTGLSGIPAIRKLVKNVQLIRPILDFSKNEIKEYAKRRNLLWREDHTNKLSLYTRNRIRNELIPFMKESFSESIIDTINRAAKHINGADEFITSYVSSQITKIVEFIDQETIAVDTVLLSTYSDFIKGEIIKAVLDKYFRIFNLELNSIFRIISLISAQTGAVIELKENIIAIRERENIVFASKNVLMNYKEKISFPGEYRIGKYKLNLSLVNKNQVKYNDDPNTEYIDTELLPPYLEIRSWKNGDTFSPIGMQGTMTVSDFLTNIKVPSYLKQNTLLLTNQVDIIWVCGYRLSDKFKITNKTKKILKAQLIHL